MDTKTFIDDFDRADSDTLGNDWHQSETYPEGCQILSNRGLVSMNSYISDYTTIHNHNSIAWRYIKSNQAGGFVPVDSGNSLGAYSKQSVYMESEESQSSLDRLGFLRDWQSDGDSSLSDQRCPVFGFEYVTSGIANMQAYIFLDIRDLSGPSQEVDFWLVVRYLDGTWNTQSWLLDTRTLTSESTWIYFDSISLTIEDYQEYFNPKTSKKISVSLVPNENLTDLTPINEVRQFDYPQSLAQDHFTDVADVFFFGIGTVATSGSGDFFNECYDSDPPSPPSQSSWRDMFSNSKMTLNFTAYDLERKLITEYSQIVQGG